MAGFFITYDFTNYTKGFLRSILQSIRKLLPGLLNIKTLEIGSPLNSGMTISINPHISNQDLSEGLDQLLAYTKSKNIKLIVIRDFQGNTTNFENILQQKGFTASVNLPNAQLKIRWNSFAEYTADLKYRRRKDLKRKMKYKKKYEIQTVLSNEENCLDLTKEYVRLSEKFYKELQQHDRNFFGEAYYHTIFQKMKGNVYWLQQFKDGELVNYSHGIVYNNEIIPMSIISDHNHSTNARLYFNAVFEWIKFAITNGLDAVEGGPTSYDAKTGMGFSIFPQRLYLKIGNSILMRIIAYSFSVFIEREMKKCHYAFKKNAYQTIWDGSKDF
jgi:predicted N-acyltransferase